MSRVVVHLKAKGRPDGQRFLVKEYPKDKEWRRLRVADHLVAKLRAFIQDRRLNADDLLFPMPAPNGPVRRSRPEPAARPTSLGLTDPNEKGRQYLHGTLTAYQAGRCRCQHCRDAVAVYRAQRRAEGRDHPGRPRPVATDGHISNDRCRTQVWAKALAQAAIGSTSPRTG